MRIELETEDKNKSVLDEGAAIYGDRDERKGREKFKDLDKAGRWQFFKDYVLARLIGGLIGVGCLVYFLVSVFGPKPETVFDLISIDSPFSDEQLDRMRSDLEAMFVTDPEGEEIAIDTTYYFSSDDDYTSRMKLMTVIAANEVDAMIVPESELQTQVNNVAADLKLMLSDEMYERLAPYLEYLTPVDTDVDGNLTYGEEGAYAINVTDYLSRVYGTEIISKYYLIVPVNAPHADRIERYVAYVMGFDD